MHTIFFQNCIRNLVGRRACRILCNMSLEKFNSYPKIFCNNLSETRDILQNTNVPNNLYFELPAILLSKFSNKYNDGTGLWWLDH